MKTERVLQAQIQDNERRRSGDRFRGGKSQTLSTAELSLMISTSIISLMI